MPNEAKLGLVTGLAVVMLIGVTYFRKEPSAATGTETQRTAAQPPAKDADPAPPSSVPGVQNPPAVDPHAPAPPNPPMERPAPIDPPTPGEDPFASENAQNQRPLLPLPPPPMPMEENSVPPLPPPSPSSLPAPQRVN